MTREELELHTGNLDELVAELGKRRENRRGETEVITTKAAIAIRWLRERIEQLEATTPPR